MAAAAVAPSDAARALGGPDEARAFRCFCVPPGYVALLDLLVQPLGERTIYPRVYLSASHEMFGITLILTWVLTLIWFPKQIFKHPAKPIIGSFNPCFGWDYPPASYVALAFCSINVYLTWRYAWLELTRTHLSTPSGDLTFPQQFAKYTAISLAFASNCWLLLWVVGPEDGNWKGHTGLFVFYAAASYLACLGNYVEMRYGPRKAVIETKHTVFIAVYGFAALFLPTVYFIDLIWSCAGARAPSDARAAREGRRGAGTSAGRSPCCRPGSRRPRTSSGCSASCRSRSTRRRTRRSARSSRSPPTRRSRSPSPAGAASTEPPPGRAR